MKIKNENDYTIIKPSENLIDEAAKDFILECEIEIAKHKSEVYVIDLKSVKQLDSSVIAFFVSTFCATKNNYYFINVDSSTMDIFKMMQLDKCTTFIDSLDEIKV